MRIIIYTKNCPETVISDRFGVLCYLINTLIGRTIIYDS